MVYAVGIVRSRHSYFVFIPGASIPTYSEKELEELKAKEKETKEYNGQAYTPYEATQYQRQIENQIRKLKRENIIYKETGLDTELKANNAKIKALRAEYKDFSDKMEIRPKDNRTQI